MSAPSKRRAFIAKLRRAAKIGALAYVALALFVAVHVPRSVGRLVESLNPQGLLFPIAAPQIMATYLELAASGAWLSAPAENVVTIDHLMRKHGTGDGFERTATFDTSPPGFRPGEEGSSTMRLSPENYTQVFIAAAPGINSGTLLQLGRFTCLTEPDRSRWWWLFEPAQCYQIRDLSQGSYQFAAVDDGQSFPAKHDPRYRGMLR